MASERGKTVRKTKNKLTPKQARFVQEYLVDLNATQAAIRGKYSKKTAYSIGQENLKKPEIQAAIQKAFAERSERTKIDADYVLIKAKELLERCLQEVEPVMVAGGAVQATDSQGRLVFKFDSNGAAKALKLIGDHVRVNAFKPTDGDGKPIDQNWVVTFVDAKPHDS